MADNNFDNMFDKNLENNEDNETFVTIDPSELRVITAQNNVLGQVVNDLNLEEFADAGAEPAAVQIQIPEVNQVVQGAVANPVKEEELVDLGIDPQVLVDHQLADDIIRALDGYQPIQNPPQVNMMNSALSDSVRVEITEQPAANRLRFRYAVEGRGAGALLGHNSKGENRTFPTIRIHGYQGPAVVIVSCVEYKPLPAPNSNRYRTHPHKIVGRECQKGVCKKMVNIENMTCEFKHLGIQCMRRSDTEESLKERQAIRVDPFMTGFDHIKGSFDLNRIRLAFQVFLQPHGPNGKSIMVRQVVTSQVIMDRKTHGDLKIENYSDNRAPFEGGKKILLFTEKVIRDDIEVHFGYTNPTDGTQNTLHGHFSPNDVHHQFGIALTTPVFTNFHNVTSTVEAQMYLFKKSDGQMSEPVPFYFHPKEEQEERKPVIVAVRQNAAARPKRDREAMRGEPVVPDQPSTREIALPPQRFRSGGGNVVEIEPKRESEPEESRMSALILGASAEAVQAIGNPAMNPPIMSSEQFRNYMQQNEQQSNTNMSADDLLKDVNVEQEAQNVFETFDSDLLSQQLSETSISEPRKSRNIQRQNSGLETPDVSMEQSKTKNTQNDL